MQFYLILLRFGASLKFKKGVEHVTENMGEKASSASGFGSEVLATPEHFDECP